MLNPLNSILSAGELAFLREQNEAYSYLCENFERAAAVAPKNRFDYGMDQLKELPRRGYVVRGIPADSIESVYQHEVEMADLAQKFYHVAWAILPDDRYSVEVGLTNLTRMIKVHDLGEALIRDFAPRDKLDKSIKYRLEQMALKVLLEHDPEKMKASFEEFERGFTPLAQWGNDLDKIQMMHKVMEYQHRFPTLRGNLSDFWSNLPPHKMRTSLGQAILIDLHEQNARLQLS